uniref:hypothetical protein n=1 Tax=Micromonospora acroterricola TaxID=2202421 RepID=UPI00137534F4|nr:hypothetical protein [Micromonospora acroterricola]
MSNRRRSGRAHRSLVAGRYQLLDRDSDPASTLPAIPELAPVNRPRDPYRKRGS